MFKKSNPNSTKKKKSNGDDYLLKYIFTFCISDKYCYGGFSLNSYKITKLTNILCIFVC